MEREQNERNGATLRWGQKSLSLSGPTGIIIALLLALGGTAYLLWQHGQATSAEHRAIGSGFDSLKCVLAIEAFAERRRAVLSGDACHYLTTQLEPPDPRGGGSR